MEPLISVIIPIYKVEIYLKQCIDSILAQTYKNLEIILVNDGSPDRCGIICDEYAQQDSRIVVIHKKNGGLSDARNAGLRICNGEYIVFVDSDDWMELDGIETLYRLAAENSADLVIGGVEKIDDQTKRVIWTTNKRELNNTFFQNRQEAIKDVMLNGCASWARLYKKSVHKNVFFPVGEINEDEAIVLTLYENCKIIVKTNQIVYKYRNRSESITSASWHKQKMDWYKHCKNNAEYVGANYVEIKDYAEYRYCTSIIWCLNNMTATPEEFCEEIKQLRQELKVVLKRVSRKNLLSNKEKIRANLLIYFYYLYVSMIKLLGKRYT